MGASSQTISPANSAVTELHFPVLDRCQGGWQHQAQPNCKTLQARQRQALLDHRKCVAGKGSRQSTCNNRCIRQLRYPLHCGTAAGTAPRQSAGACRLGEVLVSIGCSAGLLELGLRLETGRQLKAGRADRSKSEDLKGGQLVCAPLASCR